MTSLARPWLVVDVPALDAWPVDLPCAGERFSLLLVLDEADPRADARRAWNVFATRAIEQGLAYFCAWGPHCESTHDLMDETLIQHSADGGKPAPFVMTSWHANESLEEAVWFATICAIDCEIQDPCTAPVVVGVLRAPETVTHVRALLEAGPEVPPD